MLWDDTRTTMDNNFFLMHQMVTKTNKYKICMLTMIPAH